MEAPTSPGLDSASVAITVSPLVPVSGKGDIKYTASVRLSINDVEIELAGWTLRQDKAGKMRCFRPAYRDFFAALLLFADGEHRRNCLACAN